MRPRGDGQEGLFLEGDDEAEIALTALRFMAADILEHQYDDVLAPAIRQTETNVVLAQSLARETDSDAMHTYGYAAATARNLLLALAITGRDHADQLVASQAREMLIDFQEKGGKPPTVTQKHS